MNQPATLPADVQPSPSLWSRAADSRMTVPVLGLPFCRVKGVT